MDDIIEFSDSDDDLFQENNNTEISYKKSHYDPTNFIKLRYHSLRETSNINGYVVNVHDSINFDIDLNLSPDLQKRYENVITNNYTYYDFNKYYFDNIGTELNKKLIPKIGTTHRCRLKGIGTKQLNGENIWKSNKICIDIKKIIDANDGWITCTLSDIDVYQRLLIDIYVTISNKKINLHDYLLEKTKDDPDPIFYKYTTNKV